MERLLPLHDLDFGIGIGDDRQLYVDTGELYFRVDIGGLLYVLFWRLNDGDAYMETGLIGLFFLEGRDAVQDSADDPLFLDWNNPIYKKNKTYL